MPLAVDSGTVSRSSLAFDRLTVSRVVFPAAKRLARHSHADACTAVVVDGAVRKRFRRAEYDAVAGALVTMPPDEPHADAFGSAGATIVVVEEAVERTPATCRLDWDALRIAGRIERELAAPDAYTPLAVEGLALELVAVAARQQPRRVPPRWLSRARERLLDAEGARVSLDELAREACVDPAHFARSFRRAYGVSVGAYARGVRLEWAAGELGTSDRPLIVIAADAGFADQSHFTRAFKQRFGITPARYRAAVR